MEKENVLIIGSGGREFALYQAVKKSPLAENVYVCPGNGGIPQEACLPSYSSFDGLLQMVNEHDISFVVVGPEQPLVEGVVDFLERQSVPVFGPSAWCARIEGSKNFAKQLMEDAGVPTADYRYFERYEEALQYVEGLPEGPLVVKADGLAAGKGVTVAAKKEEAIAALQEVFVERIHGEDNTSVVIEEFLTGEECSLFAVCDGETALPLIPAQDHKQVFEGDRGPNTGGMGAYCPAPILSEDDIRFVESNVFKPVMEQFKKLGHPYKGVLYAGLMVDKKRSSIKILEFNARFGDPETQIVLPALDGDWLEVFKKSAAGKLAGHQLKWKNESFITVVLAAPGYPGKYNKGIALGILPAAEDIVHAGTRRNEDGIIESNGGRVLNITASGPDLKTAQKKVYERIDELSLNDLFCRRDIAFKALR